MTNMIPIISHEYNEQTLYLKISAPQKESTTFISKASPDGISSLIEIINKKDSTIRINSSPYSIKKESLLLYIKYQIIPELTNSLMDDVIKYEDLTKQILSTLQNSFFGNDIQ